MKTLLAFAAAVATTAVLSVPASATTVGCDPAEPYTTVKAIDCRVWNNSYRAQMPVVVTPTRHAALAYSPRARVQQPAQPPAEDMSAYPADKN